MKREPGLFLYLFLPAVTMSLGWGLRGTIGGGPMGATIPGAMVALALCLLLGRQNLCGLIVAFGAIGFGIGGEMTYGQTINFARAAETVWWGLTGMTVKGAVWGLSGGVLLGLSFVRRRFTVEEIGTGLLYMVVGTVAGWGIINRPKLLYFSDRFKEPREEVWAAIAVGAISLLGYLYARGKGKIPGTFAFWGMIFGGIGFGGGGLFIRLSAAVPKAEQIYPSWKAMEFFFGLMLGLGLGIAAYRHRKELQADDDVQNPLPPATDAFPPVCSKYLTAVLVVFGALWVHFHVGFAATFSVMGALWLMVALHSEPLAWQLGISFTVLGFVRDMFYGIYKAFQPFLVTQPSEDSAHIWSTAILESLPNWMWLLTFIAALPIVGVVHRDSIARQRNPNENARLLDLKQTLLALSWLGVAVALLKILVLPILTGPVGLTLDGMRNVIPIRKMQVQISFVLLGILMTAALVPIKARNSSDGSSAG